MAYIVAVGLLSALGKNLQETAENISKQHAPGLHQNSQWLTGGRSTWVGEVITPLLSISGKKIYNSRNNQMLLTALEQIRPEIDETILKYGKDRVGVILGTSTSGLNEAYEGLYAHEHSRPVDWYTYEQQELGNTSSFVANHLDITGPCYTVSTACSSGARAIISAASLLNAGVVDAVITGGVDTLNPVTVNGFASLGVLSEERCIPFAQKRSGISIGEAAAVFLLSKDAKPNTKHRIAILGSGESSDAWHMSAPHPEGIGAKMAIQQALREAKLKPSDVGYISLHGTATLLNDQVEANVIHDLFGENVPCSSIKHLTGHTLGAAGSVGAAIGYLLLTHGDILLPAQDFSKHLYDQSLPAFGLLQKPAKLEKKIILCNAFAFAGNNACLALGELV